MIMKQNEKKVKQMIGDVTGIYAGIMNILLDIHSLFCPNGVSVIYCRMCDADKIQAQNVSNMYKYFFYAQDYLA